VKSKVVVIGAGYWGKNLVRTFYQFGALAAIVDVDETVRAAMAKAYPDVAVAADLSEITRSQTITAAAIATPADTHFKIASQALESDFDLFIEKPMTTRLREAESLVRFAAERNRILMVGHLPLFSPVIAVLKELLLSKELGRIYSLHCERLNLGRIRTVENALWSLGVHDLAVLQYLMGESPHRVSAVGHSALRPEIVDDVYLHLDYPGGIRAHIHVSWLWPEKRRRLTIVGEKGFVVYDEVTGRLTRHHSDFNPDLPITSAEKEIFSSKPTDLLGREIHHFLARLDDRQTPLADGKSGIEIIRVMEQAFGGKESGVAISRT